MRCSMASRLRAWPVMVGNSGSRAEPLRSASQASQFLSSPFDTDAHLGRKNTTGWVGYKVHLTETCEDDAPNLITHVETTAAPTADGDVTPRVHRALQA